MRYVRVKAGFFIEKNQVDKIYNLSEPFPTHLEFCENYTWEEVLSNINHKKYFEIFEQELQYEIC